MKKNSSTNHTYLDRIRSGFRAHGLSNSPKSKRPTTVPPPVANPNTTNLQASNDDSNTIPFPSAHDSPGSRTGVDTAETSNTVVSPSPESPAEAQGEGAVIEKERPAKKNLLSRFYHTGKDIILSSYINLLLVFVPIGIAAESAGLEPSIIFAMNAVAIVPLAGLLSHATESVAKRMGDTVGALMNVTFGNAVELIIFMYVCFRRDQDKKEREALLKALSYQSHPISSDLFPFLLIPFAYSHALIALVKNEIRIVQASLLGSILANLLLILGMCFLVGGLRFREQIYNSTVTQMSACLLSLSVMSLLLPTAFHASFANETDADRKVLKVSRGTSVVLLMVYAMYLLFQLKSHAYMYQSTPQNLIDEELAPGPVAAWLDSSTSDSDTSSDSDSDGSSGSNTTAKRIRRVMRGGRRRRKSSSASKETVDLTVRTRGSSFANGSVQSPYRSNSFIGDADIPHRLGAIDAGDEADHEGDQNGNLRTERPQNLRKSSSSKKEKKHKKKRHQKKDKHREKVPDLGIGEPNAGASSTEKQILDGNEPRRVDFAISDEQEAQHTDSSKRPFTLRGLRPALPKSLSQNVFMQPSPTGSPSLAGLQSPPVPSGPIPRVRYGIRRTNSLPDRLKQTLSAPPPHVQSNLMAAPTFTPLVDSKVEEEDDENISRTTAVVLLLISTGLVAICAEFMVDSISSITDNPNAAVSEAFIGLIILPIVGNAAEHVTAVTVASKNKMDLAIGVAVGSSIQIALFVTPLVVLLGWCMGKDMSLFFTLFETVSLFVSCFIVNFLVLDGRSNYLEGALLCAAYVIIAVAAFFYPSASNSSTLGGSADARAAVWT